MLTSSKHIVIGGGANSSIREQLEWQWKHIHRFISFGPFNPNNYRCVLFTLCHTLLLIICNSIRMNYMLLVLLYECIVNQGGKSEPLGLGLSTISYSVACHSCITLDQLWSYCRYTLNAEKLNKEGNKAYSKYHIEDWRPLFIYCDNSPISMLLTSKELYLVWANSTRLNPQHLFPWDWKAQG